ncbi:MAG TPA: tetratricopeptide repeat protein [Clostridia bacterium]|nr:tetratricopeptide repeat protein [Clostridia bacterium]
MQSDVTHSATLWKLYAWADARKKQLLYGLVGLLAVGLVVFYVVWQKGEKQAAANHALSDLQAKHMNMPSPGPDAAAAYFKLAADYPGSDAAARAELLGAGELFAQGNYAEAQTHFQKFTREHPQSPMAGQALLGIAASLDAQNKTNEAVTAYQQVIERRPNDPVTPQARFALGRIYEAQGKWDLARNAFEEVAKGDPFGSLGSEAGMRSEELLAKHPELKPAPVVGTNAPPMMVPGK